METEGKFTGSQLAATEPYSEANNFIPYRHPLFLIIFILSFILYGLGHVSSSTSELTSENVNPLDGGQNFLSGWTDAGLQLMTLSAETRS